MTLKQNCLRCSHYFECKDPAKSIIYSCSRFSTMEASSKQEAQLLEDILQAPILSFDDRTSNLPVMVDSSDELDAFKMLKSVIKDNRIVSPDIKVPEGDFPEAPNFYTWCVSDKYLNQKPFIEQAIIGTRLFAEYCVAEGSLIITADGVKRIEDVCSSKVGMHKYVSRIATSVGIEKTSKAGLTSKSRKCLSLKTYKNGRSITVTPEHRVLIFRDGSLQWIEARNVRIGDFLTAKIGQNLWPKKSVILPKIKVSSESEIDGRKVKTHVTRVPKKSSVELARFVGYCLSDGTIDGYRVGFINTCERLRNDFVKCGHKLFGIQFKTRSYTPKHGKQVCYTAGHASVSTSNVLAELGIKLGTCYDKEIPDFILQAPKQEVIEFIKALFDCDGYMQRNRIGICMSSKKLVDSLSVLLDNLGIYHYREVRTIDSANHPNIKNKKNRGNKDQQYVIEIRDIRKFCEIIGTNNTQRSEAFIYNIEHGCDASDLNTSFQHNVKPGSIPCFDTFVARLTEAKSEYHGLSLKQAVSSCHRSKSVSLDRILTEDLFAYCTRYDCLDIYNELVELQKHNFAYYEVCNISDAGKHQVYDLTVPGSESFVCNGINVHNCPDCSDLEWFLHDHKVNDSLIKFERRVALLEHGRCPHCHKTRLHFFKKRKLNAYVELALSAGQRSGKSALTAMLTSYIVHRAIKLERPNEVYGLLKATILQGTFVALTFAQAKDTLWDPFYGNLLDSPWFQSYHAMLDQVQSRYGEDELYKLKDTFVAYKHRRISVYPAGPDKRVLRGRTRLFACLDGDSLVSTSNGLQAIKHDLYGERTHVGTNHFKVVDWAATGTKECFRVTTKTGNYIECTGNHELKTQRGWVRTDSLRKGDKLALSLGGHFPRELRLKFNPTYEPLFAPIYRAIEAMDSFELEDLKGFGRSVTPIVSQLRKAGLIQRHYYKGRNGSDGRCRCYYTVEKHFNAEQLISQSKEESSFNRGQAIFPKNMTPELASLIGYLIADGSYNEDAVEFFFASSVSARLKHFKKCYKATFGILPKEVKYTTTQGTKMTRYAISYTNVKDFFRYLGLEGVTAERKQLPWSILEAPRECVVACLRAMYDCDGGVRHSKIFYESVSFSLLHQVQLVLQRLGILSHIKVKTLKDNLRRNTVHALLVDGSEYQKLFKSRVGFSTNKLILPENPKACTYATNNGLVWVPITGRKPIGKRKVYDITVDDEDHGFTANGIVVHNSIDELGWFPNDVDSMKNVKMNATEVYIALERSLLTVRAASRNVIKRGFYNVPMGYFINISSPSSVRDKIMELVRKSQHSTKILGLCKPTWEMNPHVPKSVLAEEFKKDPVAAMRDYGAQPPLTNNAFISNKDSIINALGDKKNGIKLNYEKYKTTDGAIELYGALVSVRTINRPCILSLDAGYSNNSFAFALGYLSKDKLPVISVVGEIIPTLGMRINHSLMYTHLLAKLFDYCNIVKVVADRWNSLKVLADMEVQFGAERQIYSLKYADMQMFKSYLDDGQLTLPSCATPIDEILKYDHSEYPACFKNRPMEHFLLQLLTVQDTGNAVLKGDQLTDDIARAAMLLVQQLIDVNNEELLSGPVQEMQSSMDATQMAVYRNYSGGGSGSSMGGAGVSQGSNLGMIRSRT